MTGTNGAPVADNLRELEQKYNARIGEARALLEPYKSGEKPAPPEVITQFKAMQGDIDGLKASIESFRALSSMERDQGQPVSTPVAWRESVADEGSEQPVDAKSWRRFEVKDVFGSAREFRYSVPLAVSENVKAFKGANGKVMTQKQYERAYADGHEIYLRKGLPFVRENYPVEYKALSEGSDSAGGFTVPVDFQAELIKKTAMLAAVRPLASVIQTNRDVVIFPRVPYKATASDDSGLKRYTSAGRLTWTGELPATSTTARITDQTFGQLEIKVNTAIASQLLSNDLIEDSAFDMAGYASDNLAEAFALGEDYAFLQGSGVAQPMGLVTSATLAVAGDSPPLQLSGTSAAITTSGDAHAGVRMLDVFYNLPAQYRRNAVWMLSSITLEMVENLVDGSKRPLISSLIGGANIGIGSPDMIKGRPIVVDEFMPDANAANAFGVVLGDFKGYTIADRVQFSIQRYTELYVETNFTLLLARKRVGGLCTQPWKFQFMKSAAS